VLRLRKFILGLLWFVPFIYSFAAVSLPFFIYQTASEPYNPAPEIAASYLFLRLGTHILLILLGVSPVALCITSAGTLVQYHRRKEATRLWAISCGIAFLASAVPIIVPSIVYHDRFSSGGLGLFALGAIHMAAGISIMVAFMPRSSVNELLSAEPREVKVKGDGTTSLSYLFAITVVMVGLIVIDSQVHRWGQQHGLPRKSGFLLDQLIFFGALFISTALHEFGHIAAGWSVGMKLLSVRIGPFHAGIKEGRWRLIRPSSWRCLFQGGVEIIPPKPRDYEKSRAILTAAGGPLANLAGGGVALLALFAAKGSFYESDWEWLGSIAAICVMFFLANLIPVREASFYSDGARIYQILSGNVMEDFRRIAAMTEATKFTPTRPRDYDISLIERTASNDDLGAHRAAFLHLVASDYYLDHGRMEDACTALSKADAAADEVKSLGKENCGAFVSRAVCLAQDREMAKKWWERRLQAEQFDPKNESETAVLAHCIIENRLAEADDVWRRQLERTNRLPDTGERAFDLHYLRHLRRLLDEALKNSREESIPSVSRYSALASEATTTG
jgi:Zn-dependent protease